MSRKSAIRRFDHVLVNKQGYLLKSYYISCKRFRKLIYGE